MLRATLHYESKREGGHLTHDIIQIRWLVEKPEIVQVHVALIMGYEGSKKFQMGGKFTGRFTWHMWIFVSWFVGYCVKFIRKRRVERKMGSFGNQVINGHWLILLLWWGLEPEHMFVVPQHELLSFYNKLEGPWIAKVGFLFPIVWPLDGFQRGLRFAWSWFFLLCKKWPLR